MYILEPMPGREGRPVKIICGDRELLERVRDGQERPQEWRVTQTETALSERGKAA